MACDEIVPRPGTMDAVIVAEMQRDPYGVRGRVKAGDVVIDAGANIGAFARFVLQDAPSARVFCIEPMPSNVDALRRNLNGAPNCEIINAALMGKPGPVILHDYGAASSACHSVLKLGIRAEGTVEVPGVTLPEIMEKHGLNRVDFLKLDVQGAEFEIIASCPSHLLANVEYIAMEAHAGIANAETVLGEVPDYRRRLAGLIRKLAKTHLCVRGYPTRRSAVLGWALRESVSWACVWRHRLRLWVVGPFVRFKALLVVLAARTLPGPVKAAIRRLIKR